MENTKKHIDKIPFSRAGLILLLFLLILFSIFTYITMFVRHDMDIFRRYHPIKTLGLIVVAMLLAIKTLYISKEEIVIRYSLPFIKRVVPWERVRMVAFVNDKNMIFVLDDCPPIEESGKRISFYLLRNAGKVIDVSCIGTEEKQRNAQIIRKYCRDVRFIRCDPV